MGQRSAEFIRSYRKQLRFLIEHTSFSRGDVRLPARIRPESGTCLGEVALRACVSGLQANRFFEVPHCFYDVAAISESNTDVIVCFGVVGAEA